MELTSIFILSFMSFLAGFIDSIAGGGGLIMIPALVIVGIPPQVALGTNKFAAFFGTSTALVNFIRKGKVIWKIVVFGLVFSLIGSVIGTKLILYFDQKTTAKIIIMLLPITALITFLPKKQLKTSGTELSRRNLYVHIPLLCVIIGFYDGFFGPGTGTFLILGFYLFLGLHLVNASAVAKVFNITSNLGSLFTFALANKVLYSLAIPLALSNVVGGYVGSLLAIHQGQKFIKIFLLIVFIILFATLIVKLWNR
jgi:uncharacterized membrane protein YfcA